MKAARRGWRCAHRGSYGTDAQPIIHPAEKKVSSGTTTMPTGSRLMCGVGSTVSWPPWYAVGSPPRKAAQAWQNSWHVVEMRNPRYHIAKSARVEASKSIERE